jgi:hypothetical protein
MTGHLVPVQRARPALNATAPLYLVTGDDAVAPADTLLAASNSAALTAAAWNTVMFGAPVAVTHGNVYKAAVHSPTTCRGAGDHHNDV